MAPRLDRRAALIAGLALASFGAMLFVPPVPQDPTFHDFSDQRPLFGIPHLFNIASNLPFLLVGLAGLAYVFSSAGARSFREKWERGPYAVLFAGVTLVFFGSTYYHWNPTSATLFWDRLPLAILFATFLSITVIERIHARAGAALLAPLVAAGVASLVFWRAADDLRFYVLIQGLAMALAPLMVVLFPPRYTRGRDLLPVAGIYAAAQACALYDAELFALGGFLSGHTLKHLLAAVAAWRMLAMLRARRPAEGAIPADARRNLMTVPEA